MTATRKRVMTDTERLDWLAEIADGIQFRVDGHSGYFDVTGQDFREAIDELMEELERSEKR